MSTRYLSAVNFDTPEFDESAYPIPPVRVERSATQCNHTPMPDGYMEAIEWARRAGKTHSQVKCPCCGKWAIWLPKRVAAAIRRSDAKEARRVAKAYKAMWNARASADWGPR